MDGAKPRIRRKSSAIKVSLSRSNTYSSTTYSDETDVDGPAPGQSIPNVPTSSLGAQLEALKTTVQKRITTWAYLKSAHEGKVFWFNTVLLGQDELQSSFEHSRMKVRTTRFAILGMSLSSLLDVHSAHDFLRGLYSLVQDFESVQEDKFDVDRKNRGLFRVASRPRKSAPGGSDFSMGLHDLGDASFLFTPNIPFELDYFQVLFTTCDMLVETYQKILSYLGPSPLSHSHTASGGLSPTLADLVLKIDTRLTKLITQITKDVDTVARRSIKNELQSLSGGFDWSADGGVEVS